MPLISGKCSRAEALAISQIKALPMTEMTVWSHTKAARFVRTEFAS